MMRPPLLSILLGAVAGGLMLLPPGTHGALYFDYHQLAAGNMYGLVTGHWMHADGAHLGWNLAALLMLAALIEQQSRRLLLWSIAIGTIAVDLLLLSPISELERYCGLSGLLNTLMGVALYLCWRSSRSPLVVITGAFYLLKIALEIHSGQSVFTQITWPPYAMAHLAGLLGFPVALALGGTRGNTHGHLV